MPKKWPGSSLEPFCTMLKCVSAASLKLEPTDWTLLFKVERVAMQHRNRNGGVGGWQGDLFPQYFRRRACNNYPAI